jgi:undecaprenyl diphosphate synthase
MFRLLGMSVLDEGGENRIIMGGRSRAKSRRRNFGGQSWHRNFAASRGRRCAIISASMRSFDDVSITFDDGESENGLPHSRHVAIVSDGSARWAAARGLTIEQGHEAAADNVLARIGDAIELGIEELTLYAFSTENWSRPAREVEQLLGMLARRIDRDTPSLQRQGVSVRFIGRRDRTGGVLAEAMGAAECDTAGNNTITVYVALDHGGRDEIVRAAMAYQGGGEAEFARLMSAPEMHDPDLVIRAGGEQRISNFLLWQTAYSELVFRTELWPEFGREAFEESLREYSRRTRRFGGRAVVPALP